MSRFLTFALFSTLLILTSCGGGWSDEQKAQVMGTYSISNDCLDEMIKSYPSPEDYNSLSDAEKAELFKDCEKNETNEDNIESF